MENIFSDIKVLVIGDIMLDYYIYGDTDRVSEEAPVPIVNVNKRIWSPGGAANVAKNIVELGGECSLIGKICYDENGQILSDLLRESKVDFNPVLIMGYNTTTKTRIISKHQQLLRFDEEDIEELNEYFSEEVYKIVESKISDYSMIIISDYGKGFCSQLLCKKVIDLANKNNIKVLVDPKDADWDKYNGAFLISPNVKELSQICGCVINNDDSSVVEKGKQIYGIYTMDYLLVTRSEKGATLIGKNIEHHIPSVAKEVFDVSGAGDTMISVIALFLCKGDSIKTAIDNAIRASGIVIGKVGTIPITYDELMG